MADRKWIFGEDFDQGERVFWGLKLSTLKYWRENPDALNRAYRVALAFNETDSRGRPKVVVGNVPKLFDFVLEKALENMKSEAEPNNSSQDGANIHGFEAAFEKFFGASSQEPESE